MSTTIRDSAKVSLLLAKCDISHFVHLTGCYSVFLFCPCDSVSVELDGSLSCTAHTWVSLNSRCVDITHACFSLIVFFSLGSVLNNSVKRCSLGFSRHWLLMSFDKCLVWNIKSTRLVMDMLVSDGECGLFKWPLSLNPVCYLAKTLMRWDRSPHYLCLILYIKWTRMRINWSLGRSQCSIKMQ